MSFPAGQGGLSLQGGWHRPQPQPCLPCGHGRPRWGSGGDLWEGHRTLPTRRHGLWTTSLTRHEEPNAVQLLLSLARTEAAFLGTPGHTQPQKMWEHLPACVCTRFLVGKSGRGCRLRSLEPPDGDGARADTWRDVASTEVGAQGGLCGAPSPCVRGACVWGGSLEPQASFSLTRPHGWQPQEQLGISPC